MLYREKLIARSVRTVDLPDVQHAAGRVRIAWIEIRRNVGERRIRLTLSQRRHCPIRYQCEQARRTPQSLSTSDLFRHSYHLSESLDILPDSCLKIAP